MLRRQFLQALGSAAAFPVFGPLRAEGAEAVNLTYGLPAGAYGVAQMGTLPGKRPLIEWTARPPNYEAPLSAFATPFTPNDLFFVRYHLAGIPPQIDVQQWQIAIGGGGVATPLQLGFQDLQRGFEQVEVPAVCQCSGSRRGLSDPHVPGVQWGVGAMGCARWRGPRVKDILAKAGIKPGAVEVVFNGADGPVLTTTPDFVKSLPIAKVMDENTIVALEMNGEPLPHFNGYPARLIVPGWTGTYWMKHLISIEPVMKPFDGFWMKAAYRIPTGMFPTVQIFATQQNEMTTPITEMVVNSLITLPAEGARFRIGEPVTVTGLAWDGGYGIRSVVVSIDNGASWREAMLGEDSGRYAFRTWAYRFTAAGPASQTIRAKATNRLGESQVETLIFNGAGYHNNVVRPTTIVIA
ncbi:MAG TPA: molybdopterin-dependent oxidoreductase [Micropepsaceae bacterium]|nr:molybdopterin-dependent oxidoreductase [Micropepsaceae bacterium]